MTEATKFKQIKIELHPQVEADYGYQPVIFEEYLKKLRNDNSERSLSKLFQPKEEGIGISYSISH